MGHFVLGQLEHPSTQGRLKSIGQMSSGLPSPVTNKHARVHPCSQTSLLILTILTTITVVKIENAGITMLSAESLVPGRNRVGFFDLGIEL